MKIGVIFLLIYSQTYSAISTDSDYTPNKVRHMIISSTETGCVVEIPPIREEAFVLVSVPPNGRVWCKDGEVVDQDIWIRRYRVARIRVSPSNFSRKVEITWERAKGGMGLPEQNAFEDILKRHVVNYESARNWARPRVPIFRHEPVLKYKLLTVQEGIHRVEYDDVSPIVPEITSIDPRTIKIMHCGYELPIVVKGEEDGKFDPDDWFEFYAEPTKGKFTYFNLYSDTNVYWLSLGGSPGARLVVQSCAPIDAPVPDSFLCSIHFEHDSLYRLFKTYPDTIDPWLWADFTTSYGFTLNTPDPAWTGSCTLKIKFRVSNVEATVHSCKIYLNGFLIGEISYSRSEWRPMEATIPFTQNILRPVNQLVLAPDFGHICLNYIKITYYRKYRAYNGTLKFIAPSLTNYMFKIDEFVNPGIRVWKLGTSVIVDGRIEYDNRTRTYSYTFEDIPDWESRETTPTYLAQDYIIKPIAIREITSDLRSPLNRADYIIITNQELYTCGLTYASWRESKGFICKVVTPQEIYDEFNFGLVDPVAIHEFLQYAVEVWDLPPVYVLLLGDASYDHRNILGFNECIVPTRTLYDPHMVLIPSDNLYGCISGNDPIPDLLIGRLPIRSVTEFNIVFEKIRRYEENNWVGDWRKNLIFTSMNEEDHNLIKLIEDIIKKHVPKEFELTRIYYPKSPQEGPTQPDLINAINRGAILLSYIGHSGASEWSGGLLWKEAIPSLMNIDRLPFISVLGCYNGIFDRCGEEYMAELFIKSPGGGIAYWGPTGGLYPADKGLVEGPISALLSNPVNTTGNLSINGIIQCFKERRTPKTVLQQVLLGDPITPIYTPLPNVELTITPTSLRAGDSATVFGKVPLSSHGEAILTIYTNDTTQFKKIRTSVSNGEFTTGFKLPDTLLKGNGRVMCYVWNDTAEFVGMTKFSILTPNIYPIFFIPETPTSRDSVLIGAKVFDTAGVDWVRCQWGVDPPPWNIIKMELDTGGCFITKSPIYPQPPKTKVSLKIELKSWSGEIASACSSYTVLALPDLKLYSRPYLGGTSEVMICAEIVNDGEEHTDSFEVAFYTVKEEFKDFHNLLPYNLSHQDVSYFDSVFVDKDKIALRANEHAVASVPWNLKQGKVFIRIDPTNKVHESNKENNRSAIYEISVTLFNVSRELGTDGWINSQDLRFKCKIDTNSVNVSTVLELKDSLGCLTRFKVKEAVLLHPMEIVISPRQYEPGLSVYRWCLDYNLWLLINPDTTASTKKLGIFSLIKCDDTTAPHIKFNLSPDTIFYIKEDTLTLKIDVIISDESGIDIVDRKFTLTCNEEIIPDSLYSYPTEETSLRALPLVMRGTFTLGEHVLGIIAYDFNGNKAEEKLTIHIRKVFHPVEKYCWGNYPNPVRGERTKFYFEFSDVPDEFRVDLYTVSGRLLCSFRPTPAEKIEFDWDLQVDGKHCANGVYFYRVFAKKGGEEFTRILKMAILR